MSSSYFIYVAVLAVVIVIFIVSTRFAAVRHARRSRAAAIERSRQRQNGLPYPVTASDGQCSGGRTVYDVGYGGFWSTTRPEMSNSNGTGRGTGVLRVDGEAERDGDLPSYNTPSIPVPAQVYNPTYEQGSYHHHQQDVYASPTDAPPGYTVPAATTIPGPAETADLPKYVDCTLTETQQQPGPR